MNRKQRRAFAEGAIHRNGHVNVLTETNPLAVFDESGDAVSELKLRIDSTNGDVRGYYRLGTTLTIVGSRHDLEMLRDVVLPRRPMTGHAAQAQFDRTLGKIEKAIADAIRAEGSPPTMPN